MKLLFLTKSDDVLSGLIEKRHSYIVFKIKKDTGMEEEFEYLKEDFQNINHFAETLNSYHAIENMFTPPIPIDRIDYAELDKMWREIRDGSSKNND